MTEAITPIRLSHAVLKTFDVERLRRWYCTVLNAHVVFEQLPFASFITYDGEHHRIGISMIPGDAKESIVRMPGLAHLAFTYADIKALLRHYEHVRDLGIKPTICINHGPTVSFYYLDPDGNGCELLVDRFATVEEANEFIRSPVFQKNMNGIEFDPDELLARMHKGASSEELIYYDKTIPVDVPASIHRHNTLMRLA